MTTDAAQSSDSDRLARVEVEVQGIKTSLDSLTIQVSAATRTSWSTVFAGGSMFLMVVGLIGGLIAYQITDNQTKLRQQVLHNENALRAHIEDGHPRRVEQITSHNRDLINAVASRVLHIEQTRFTDSDAALLIQQLMSSSAVQDERALDP